MSYLAKTFKNVDALDLDDIILQIKNTFAVNFEDKDLAKINSLYELANLICSKKDLKNIDSCTSQQAFYKLRKAYIETQHNPSTFLPDSSMEQLFPKEARRQQIKSLEEKLGFKLNILQPPTWLTLSLLGIFIISCILLLKTEYIGIVGITIAVLGFIAAIKWSHHFSVKSVSEVVSQMLQENYQLSRSTPSYNSKEVESVIIQIFTENLNLDPNKFDRHSTFT